MRRYWVTEMVVLAACLLAQVAAAAEPDDLADLLEPIVQRHELPGMAAAIVEGDDLLGIGATGVRRRGGEEKITVDDRFHIGSCTKAMTASLCGLLVDEGTLSWDQTLAEAFPEQARAMREEYHAIALEQLLAHRSGITGELFGNGLLLVMRFHSGSPQEGRALLLKQLTKLPLEAEPGEKWIYSNSGYMLAGHMAETATGTSWEDLMRRRIFEPLEMTSAGFGAPGDPDQQDEPRGHSAGGSPVEPSVLADNPPTLGPAGTVHCSLRDWAKFISWHLRGANGDPAPLKAETMRKLHTPMGEDQSYALGWGVYERPWAGGQALSHGGSNTMWFAVVWIAPQRNFAVLVACNEGGDKAAKACDEAASAMIRHHLAE